MAARAGTDIDTALLPFHRIAPEDDPRFNLDEYTQRVHAVVRLATHRGSRTIPA